jgi:hypothetical protein
MESVWIVLAVEAHYDWQVHHVDIKSAFLNGDLADELCGVQPLGFMANGKEEMVMLHMTLYGMRQVSRA